jgi:molybdopterin-guanine dinucleotide biosynthesis protein A
MMTITALATVSVEETLVVAPAAPLCPVAFAAARIASAEAALASYPPRFTRRVVATTMVELHAEIHAECEAAREAGRREHAAWLAL